MTDPICKELEERGVVERYVSRTLGEADVAQFESHFLECARCQASIRAVTAVRASSTRSRTRAPRRQVLVTGLAIAAALGSVIVVRTFRPPSDLAALGKVAAAPAYEGAALRGPETGRDSLFAEGMRAYTAGDYQRAVVMLRNALSAGAAPEPTAFFLGASQLMLGAASDAIMAFDRVIARGESIYFPDAHFYRAMARLQLGQLDGVAADLRAARASVSLSDHARAAERALEARRSR